jgi:hypothetical protein
MLLSVRILNTSIENVNIISPAVCIISDWKGAQKVNFEYIKVEMFEGHHEINIINSNIFSKLRIYISTPSNPEQLGCVYAD